MSWIVIDTECPDCGHRDEDMIRRGSTDPLVCKACNGVTRRVPSAPKVDWDALAQGEGASPEAIRHFERKHKQQTEREKKIHAEHGDYGSRPGAD
jgi:hypothetical protein